MRYSPRGRSMRPWTLHTGDVYDGSKGGKRSGFETTPILVDGTLYLTTPFSRVIALDPASGTERWAFDPHVDLKQDDVARCIAQKPCRRRIYEATLDARLLALDAATGAPCVDFGGNRQVVLRAVPGYESPNRGEPAAGWYPMTSALTGALRWSWDPIPRNLSQPAAKEQDGVSLRAESRQGCAGVSGGGAAGAAERCAGGGDLADAAGSISLGGTIVTAAGLVFVAGPSIRTCVRSISRGARSYGRRSGQGVRTPRR
jgi:hypothetical protein